MANRNWASGGKIYSMAVKPVLVDLNFIVDSTNVDGTGIRSLKGPVVAHVFMQGQTSGGSPAPGSPVLASAATVEVLASASITNTGFSVITGDLDLHPGTSVVGFPPGIVAPPYVQHITDATALQARIDAGLAYTDLQTRPPGTLITAGGSGLDDVNHGGPLPPGTYTSASTMGLSVGATLTLDAGGNPNAVWIFQVGSAVTFGTGSTVVIINGGSSANVYWQVGSSATLGVTSTVVGTILANASISLLTGASLSGRILAGVGPGGAGSVTLDSNSASLPAGSVPTHIAGTPQPGTIVVQLENGYANYLKHFHAIVSPTSGTALKVDNSALTAGTAYVITTLGTTTAAQWQALGVPKGVTPAVGVSFIAASVGAGANTSTSRVMTAALSGSGILTLEMVGDTRLALSPNPTKNQGFGGQLILQTRDYSGAIVAPANESIISLAFLLNDSGVTVQGE